MKIAITGGKGGTGKSTLATALATALSQDGKVLLIDADVDCPGDDIILGIKLEKVKEVENMIPVFDFDKCLKCGKCSRFCSEQAIISAKGKNPFFIPDRCIGCRACLLVCPTGAISESKQSIGEIFMGSKGNLTLLSGRLKPGIEESSLVVNELKKEMAKQQNDCDYIIIDTAAGTHCPVIAALLNSDLALAIAEATPLGAHDLGLILALTKKLGIDTKVILNRFGIGDEKLVMAEAKNHQIEIVAKIPYRKEIEENYSQGESIKDKSIDEVVNWLKKMTKTHLKNVNN